MRENPKLEFEDKPADNDEILQKIKFEDILAKPKPDNRKIEDSVYLKAIADNTGNISMWITIIGILIVVGLFLQLLSSCSIL